MIINQPLILLFALIVTLPAQAEVIWVDADGDSHFIESESDNNPASIENRITPAQPNRANSKNQLAPKVDLYVTSWCPYCKKAIAFMHKNNIAFHEYDIEQDLDAAARKESLDPGYSGIPLAVINGTIIRGFSEAKYQKALVKKSN
ncbi:glutaredoxin domain-containing protein [Methylobacter sp.]|uniref:glutaredoxin domain-containing protein n=1 Tax=Methylobacter sp. TaxID=2051955 RepID=UPI002FDED1CB